MLPVIFSIMLSLCVLDIEISIEGRVLLGVILLIPVITHVLKNKKLKT